MKIRAGWMWLAAAALLVTGAGSCSSDEFPGECRNNADCPVNFRCSPDNRCLCVSDAACAGDEWCNAEGSCQKLGGCRNDQDCCEGDAACDASAWRCDTSSGRGVCLCRSDAACPEGEFCNTAGSCQEKAGCIIDADCGEAAAWRCWINPDTDIGECLCKTDAACDEAEFCNVHGYCQPVEACQTDDDCPVPGTYCDTASGECLCDFVNQTGCDADEVCNASGYCQPRPGCYDNRDCRHLEDHYCDFTTRTCIPVGECNDDVQCPLGQVCRQHVCVDGCDDNSDCPLDERCVDFSCQPGCQTDGFCDVMEYCNNGVCSDGYTEVTPFCKPCNGFTQDCGNPTNFCLIYPYDSDDYTQETGSDAYCGVDCSGDQRCPNGFHCNPIISVKSSDLCTSDLECPGTLPCLKSSEEDKGYCPCHPSQNPCGQDYCDPWTDLCANQKTPCQDDSDCVIQCEIYENEEYGGCVIGRNCGLLEGVHCPVP